MNTLYRTTGLICLLAWLTTSNADDIDPQAAEARDWINSTALSEPLQQVLDETANALLEKDKRARKAKIGVAVLNLPEGAPPQLAHWGGEKLIYPASVAKFVYLMAAYDWQERDKLVIDDDLDRKLTAMIYDSSNTATQKVLGHITGATAGARLPPKEYAAFKRRRLSITRWLHDMGILGAHGSHPTDNGGNDLHRRDAPLRQTTDAEDRIAHADYADRQGRQFTLAVYIDSTPPTAANSSQSYPNV